MPLVLDPARWSRERLLSVLAEHREALVQLESRLSDAQGPMNSDGSRRTAVDLLRDVGALAQGAATDPDLSAATLAAVVNVQYDVLLAAVDLMKSHSSLPMVPTGRPVARPAP
ncbi:MAG TPA: hypothetical protein VGV64_03485 [Thermoplasmata archaeon]|nr:hypothetical protein [Thermoplasmata archaeon]